MQIKNPKSAISFSTKASPRKLNAEGEKLFEDIKGREFLDTNADFLLNCIKDKTPKTPLVVETVAVEVLVENLNNDMFNDVKNWVYNSPMRKIEISGELQDYEVTINDVCFVLSLPLRDMYLDKYMPEQ